MFFSWKIAVAFSKVNVWSDILNPTPPPWNYKQNNPYMCYAGINTLWTVINPNEKKLKGNMRSFRCKFLTTLKFAGTSWSKYALSARLQISCRQSGGQRSSPQGKPNQLSYNYPTKIFTCGRKERGITVDYQLSMTVASTAILKLQRATVVLAADDAPQKLVPRQGAGKVSPFCSTQSQAMTTLWNLCIIPGTYSPCSGLHCLIW